MLSTLNRIGSVLVFASIHPKYCGQYWRCQKDGMLYQTLALGSCESTANLNKIP